MKNMYGLRCKISYISKKERKNETRVIKFIKFCENAIFKSKKSKKLNLKKKSCNLLNLNG